MSAKYSLETEFSSIRKTAGGEYAMTIFTGSFIDGKFDSLHNLQRHGYEDGHSSVYNVGTGYQFKKEGTQAKAAAATLSEVGFIIGDIAMPGFGVVGSALSIFEAWAGTQVTASAEDFIQIKLTYDSPWRTAFVSYPYGGMHEFVEYSVGGTKWTFR